MGRDASPGWVSGPGLPRGLGGVTTGSETRCPWEWGAGGRGRPGMEGGALSAGNATRLEPTSEHAPKVGVRPCVRVQNAGGDVPCDPTAPVTSRCAESNKANKQTKGPWRQTVSPAG